MHSNSVIVDEGSRRHVDIEVPAGPVALDIEVTTEQGGVVPAAQILVLTGETVAPNIEALRERAREAPDGPAAFYLRDWRLPPSAPPRIAGMTPGTYTVCAVPIPSGSGRLGRDGAGHGGHGAPSGRLPGRHVTAATRVTAAVPSAWLSGVGSPPVRR